MLTTVTITGTYLDQAGAPCTGTVTFAPPCIVRDNSGGTLLAGPVTVDLDNLGRLNVALPCTEQDGMDPAYWCYTVTERLDCSDCIAQYPITVPCDTATVDISTLMPEPCKEAAMSEQDCCGTVIIRGPKGDKGDPGADASTNVQVTDPITADGSGTESDPYVVGLALSTDADNNLSLGADGGLYSPVPDGSETAVTAGTNIQVTGTGTADDPYVIATTDIVTSVAAADSTVTITPMTGDVTVAVNLSTDTGNHLSAGTDGGLYSVGTTVTAADPTVTVTGDPATGYEIAAALSADTNNQLQTGSDGALYVPYTAPIGPDDYVLGDTMQRTSGSGTAEDPYVLDVHLSADAGNTLIQGSDGGLYVAPVAAGVSSVTAADSTLTIAPTTGDVVASVDVSTTAGNMLSVDNGLYAAGTSLTAEDTSLIITGDASSGYAARANISADQDNELSFGTDGGLFVPGRLSGYGHFHLTAATEVQTTWTNLPLTTSYAQNCALDADGVSVVLGPGTWLLMLTINIQGITGGDAAIYGSITNTPFSNYTSAYVPSSSKRYGVSTTGATASDGTRLVGAQAQYGAIAADVGPYTASTLSFICLRVDTEQAA